MSTATVNATLDAAADDVLAAPISAAEQDDDRPGGQAVFAAFCYEDPDSFIGRYVSQTVADLAENGTTVYLFARRHFPVDEPGVRTHAVGECAGEGMLGSVQEFTRRAANAFLRQFPAGTEGVTLLGYEWSTVPTLSLLHALRDLPAVASFHSLEWERSDMSGESSWPGSARPGPSWSTRRPPRRSRGAGCPNALAGSRRRRSSSPAAVPGLNPKRCGRFTASINADPFISEIHIL